MSYYFLFSESCDNIWDVDTTYAENEVHYYSGTDTDDEIQIDKEQQEANNTDTVTSLGTIVSDAKKKRSKAVSSSSVSRASNEGAVSKYNYNCILYVAHLRHIRVFF